jgi:hypothetical protein
VSTDDVTESRFAPDWDAALRRLRREEVLAGPCVVVFFAGLVLLTGGFAFWDGATGWLAAGVVLAVCGVAAVTGTLVRGRAHRAATHRAQAALRLHADPGPDLAARVDRQARYLVQTRWAGWLVLFGPLGLLVGGQWERSPARAGAGAVLVLAVAVGYVFWWDHRVDEARRWVADPPGPPRSEAPESTAERWNRPRRLVLVCVGLLLVGVAAGLVASLV